MDITDIKILNILGADSRTAVKDISEKVNLSAPAVKERINKMISTGLIREFTTILEPHLLGKTLTAFMFLTLRRPEKSEKFFEIIEEEKDVLSCYYLTGDFDYMIQIVTHDSESLEKMISKLRLSQEFSRTRTIIVLSTIKEKHSVAP
jgi:Lrp/AsnC family transcriptional regulator, leucine-responsive regulatory protein